LESFTMPQKKLTERTVAKIKAPDPSGRQVMYWDEELKGFGVRVSGTTNDKSYIVQKALAGKSRRITIGPCNVVSASAARIQAAIKLGDFARGIDPKAKRTNGATMGAVLEEFLLARKSLRPRSANSYRDLIEKNLGNWLEKPIGEITREMVEARHRDIALEVQDRYRAKNQELARHHLAMAQRAERPYPQAAAKYRVKAEAAAKRRPNNGHATAKGVMRAFRALYNFAVDRNANMAANPVRLRKQWHPVHARTRHLRTDELVQFYAAIMKLENAIARDYLKLVMFTGLRRREAASLKWDDVDLTAKIIRIPAVKTKAGRQLDLPMTDLIHDLLVARRAVGNTEYVFPAARSASNHIEEPKSFLQQVAAATGITISVHDLRRSYITVAESADISETALKALVNHSLGDGVTAKYVQINAERLREPAQKVCDRLKELCQIEEVEGANIARLKKQPTKEIKVIKGISDGDRR
jgi:integrase